METISFIAAFVLSLLTAVLLIGPHFKKAAEESSTSNIGEMQSYYKRLLGELELDLETRKMSEEDFEYMKEVLDSEFDDSEKK